MGIIVYWSLNSKSMCFVERFSLFIQIFFLCVGWKVKFLSNFNEPLGGPIASPGRVRRACRNLTEKAGLKANFQQSAMNCHLGGGLHLLTKSQGLFSFCQLLCKPGQPSGLSSSPWAWQMLVIYFLPMYIMWWKEWHTPLLHYQIFYVTNLI